MGFQTGGASFLKIPRRRIYASGEEISVFGLGTWAFGSDNWWGRQDEAISLEILRAASSFGINLIDTAPAYGWGFAEKIVGKFLKEVKRENFIISTKLGLDKNVPGFVNLKPERMRKELEESLHRLRVDKIDIYFIHWPDPRVRISESASVMREFYEKGFIRFVGVSNYSLEEIQEFMRYCPLHFYQPEYNMLRREREKEIRFCLENKINVISYSPLHGGVLTGKFFKEGAVIPRDLRRKNIKELKEPYFSETKKFVEELEKKAQSEGKTLPQFVINWTVNQPGITSVLLGARTVQQLEQLVSGLET